MNNFIPKHIKKIHPYAMIGFLTILFEDGSTIETLDEYAITHSENSFYKIVFPVSVKVMKYHSIYHINNLVSIIFESDEVTFGRRLYQNAFK